MQDRLIVQTHDTSEHVRPAKWKSTVWRESVCVAAYPKFGVEVEHVLLLKGVSAECLNVFGGFHIKFHVSSCRLSRFRSSKLVKSVLVVRSC